MGELDAQENVAEQMDTIKACAGLAYAGSIFIFPDTTMFRSANLHSTIAGTESIVSALSSFILAMILYPDVAAKARRELDTVIGSERLPNLHDRCSLPYVDAIVKEVLRCVYLRSYLRLGIHSYWWHQIFARGSARIATYGDGRRPL